MRNYARNLLVALALLLTLNLESTTARAQTTAFTYQGQLVSSGVPLTGTYNLTFSLFNVASGGSAIAGPVTTNGVPVNNGLFTVTIDFGGSAWNGQTNWLQIGVETNGSTSFTTLAPRQQVLPAPYAIFAYSASNLLGTLPAIQLSGTVPLAQLPIAVVTNNETGSVTLNNLTLNGTLNLPASATINAGGGLLLRSDIHNNFFAGSGAGNLTTSGSDNTAVGDDAFSSDINGGANVANGFEALFSNTNGIYNTANGFQALFNNTSGGYNTANGVAALFQNTSGFGNAADGGNALYNNTSGGYNAANGWQTLFDNTNGSFNTANGYRALFDNTSGSDNTANGTEALYSNTTGSDNTADGVNALVNVGSGTANIALGLNAGSAFSANESSNIDIGNPGVAGESGVIRIGTPGIQAATYFVGTLNLPALPVTVNAGTNLVLLADGLDNFFAGYDAGILTTAGGGEGNTAEGDYALFRNTSGLDNTVNGFEAMEYNTSGEDNTANGYLALASNTNGFNNTASGFEALDQNTSGFDNTADGEGALGNNRTGIQNTANGSAAMLDNNSGSQNTANGNNALMDDPTGNYNTADGSVALGFLGGTTGAGGTNNIALGYYAGSAFTANESSNIDIGNFGVAGESKIIRIGVPGIHTATYLSGTVYANGVALTSDRSAKEHFSSIDSQAVLAKVAALPVTKWNYKNDEGAQHIGPMAQDFHAAFGLDGSDDKHISVVDEGGVALAAIQGLNQKLEAVSAENEQLKQENNLLARRLNELEAQIKLQSQKTQ